MFLSVSGVAPAPTAVFRSLPMELGARWLASVPLLGLPLRQRRDRQPSFQLLSSMDENGKATPIPLLLTMKDRKVYVAYLDRSPAIAFGNMSHLSLAVIKSGYRDKDDLRVRFTEDYSAVFASDVAQQIALPPCKVISVADIVSASLFDIEVFQLFQQGLVQPAER